MGFNKTLNMSTFCRPAFFKVTFCRIIELILCNVFLFKNSILSVTMIKILKHFDEIRIFTDKKMFFYDVCLNNNS